MNEELLLIKLREAFKMEAEERLSNFSSGLMELEKASEPEVHKFYIEEIFREAHSLKGAARAVNLTDIETICQSMESIFAILKKKGQTIDSKSIDVFHVGIKIIENLMDPKEDFRAYEEVSKLVSSLELVRSKLEGKEISKEVSNPVSQLKSEIPQDQKGKIAQNLVEETVPCKVQTSVQEPVSSKVQTSVQEPVSSKVQTSETLRISSLKLDSLLLKSEELISLKLIMNHHEEDLQAIAVTFDQWKRKWMKFESEFRGLRTHKETNKKIDNEFDMDKLLSFLEVNRDYMKSLFGDVKALKKNLEKGRRFLGRMVDDLLDDMKKVMMLPFAMLFPLFQRMVRELSRDQQKNIDFVLKGGDVEIDKRILDEIKDPVIHILRNSIDHGMEDPDTRKKSNKDPKGKITFSVSQIDGGKIEIHISDDGRGIDAEYVKTKAVQKGIISKIEADNLTDKEVYALLFRSGFSTSPVVTEISGRGLGLAIVMESIEKLNGLLIIDSVKGKGVSFKIHLPLTLATFRGVLITVSNQRFILPSAQVERIEKIREEDIKTIENRITIVLNNRVLPLINLADVLGLKKNDENQNSHLTVAVLGAFEKQVAFIIENVIHEQEILFKSLGKQLSRVPNISGVTILGNGSVVPILNVHDLLKVQGNRIISASPSDKNSEQNKPRRKISLLVVEDSVTSRTLFKNILESAGYKVKTAVDGQEALTFLKTESFDLIISDIDMPRINGFEMTQKIRQDPKFENIPVVLVTGRETREDKEKGIDVGASAYIVKSGFDQTNLLQTIERLI